jgi:cyclopropane-fatty-acyl-phospholipid synthase
MKPAKLIVQDLMDCAGIKINGSRPWDIQVYDDRFYSRALRKGSLGLGEAYMDDWWDVPALDEFFTRLLSADLEKKVPGNWQTFFWNLGQVLINRQTKKAAPKVGEHHYDLGNDLFDTMLDRRQVYTCGYWRQADNLDDAQEAKLDLVCRKLRLQPGQTVLDIGCGWGSFAKFAAEKYQVAVVGVTISQEQVKLGYELCSGLPVQIQFKDYRDVAAGEYDHVVSLGMFEHVGVKNYRTYMQVVSDHLKSEGLFILQTIGVNSSFQVNDPWVHRYIFPNYLLPSPAQISQAIEKLFVIEDWHNFGPDYDKTLLAWYKNFAANWGILQPTYGDRFYRMWKYYLLACAGAFRARKNNLWQIVLSKKGLPGGYESVR